MQLKSLLAAALLTAPALLAAPASAADWDGDSSNWSSNRYQAERSDRGADDDVGEADDVNGRDGDDNDVADADDVNGRDDGDGDDGDRYGSAEGDGHAVYPRRWQRVEHPDYRRLRWWGENRQWHRRWRREAYGIDDGRSNHRRRDW